VVQGDGGRGIPGFELHGGIEAAAAGAERGRLAVAPGGLIREHEEEEVLMGHFLRPGECEAFGQGVRHPGESEAPQHGAEIGREGIRRSHRSGVEGG
jgi:hypothetical protein